MSKILQLVLRFCSVEVALTLHCRAPKATRSLPGACREIPTDVGLSAPRGALDWTDGKPMHLAGSSIQSQKLILRQCKLPNCCELCVSSLSQPLYVGLSRPLYLFGKHAKSIQLLLWAHWNNLNYKGEQSAFPAAALCIHTNYLLLFQLQSQGCLTLTTFYFPCRRNFWALHFAKTSQRKSVRKTLWANPHNSWRYSAIPNALCMSNKYLCGQGLPGSHTPLPAHSA